MHKNKEIILFTIMGVSFVAFLVTMIFVVANGLAPLDVDTQIANWAYAVRGEKGNGVYWFFRIITEFGYTYFIIAIILVMGIIWKFRAKLWFFAGTILFSWVFQKLIKYIINRPRPDEALWWMNEGSSSFPSGHSICVACVFILLCYFVCASPQVKLWAKYTICVVSAIMMILVPFSRIILGVHYFTDVIGGLFFGSFVAIAGIILYNFFINRRRVKIQQSYENNHANNNTTP